MAFLRNEDVYVQISGINDTMNIEELQNVIDSHIVSVQLHSKYTWIIWSEIPLSLIDGYLKRFFIIRSLHRTFVKGPIVLVAKILNYSFMPSSCSSQSHWYIVNLSNWYFLPSVVVRRRGALRGDTPLLVLLARMISRIPIVSSRKTLGLSRALNQIS